MRQTTAIRRSAWIGRWRATAGHMWPTLNCSLRDSLRRNSVWTSYGPQIPVSTVNVLSNRTSLILLEVYQLLFRPLKF